MSSAHANSKMLKEFLMEDPPTDSSMFSSFEAVLAKAFKVVVSRSRRRNTGEVHEREAKAEAKATVVKIKDIVRWSSFRDLTEDAPSGPYGSDCFATPVTGSSLSRCNTSSSGDSTSGGVSNCSSWCESDFSEGFLPTWREFARKGVPPSPLPGPTEPEEETKSFFAMETKRVSSFCEDKEQPDSPVSVIRLRYLEDEDVSVEDSFQEDEWSSDDVQDRARRTLSLVELASNSSIIFEPHMEGLLLDFFTSEFSCESASDDLEQEVLDTARRWIKGELYGANEWGIGGLKDVYVTEMDEAGRWTGLEEGEKVEIVLDAEAEVIDELMMEVLVECLAH